MASGNTRAIFAVSFKLRVRVVDKLDAVSVSFERKIDYNETVKLVDLKLQHWLLFNVYLSEIEQTILRGERNYWHLGENIYLTVDDTFVSIRRYYYNDYRIMLLPTKEGVSMNRPQWDSLMDKIKTINAVIPEMKDTEPCLYGHPGQLEYMDCGVCCPLGHDVIGLRPLGFEEPSYCPEEKKSEGPACSDESKDD